MAARYDDNFKLAAVRRVSLGGEKQADVAEDLGIGKSTLFKWVRDLEAEVIRSSSKVSAKPTPSPAPPPPPPVATDDQVVDVGLKNVPAWFVGPSVRVGGDEEPAAPITAIIDLLLSKLPDFDPAWPATDRANWFAAFNHLAGCSFDEPRRWEVVHEQSAVNVTVLKSEEEGARRSGDSAGAEARGVDGAGPSTSPVVLGLLGTVQQLTDALSKAASSEPRPGLEVRSRGDASAFAGAVASARAAITDLERLARAADGRRGDGAGDRWPRDAGGSPRGAARSDAQAADDSDEGQQAPARAEAVGSRVLGHLGGAVDAGGARVPRGDRGAPFDEDLSARGHVDPQFDELGGADEVREELGRQLSGGAA